MCNHEDTWLCFWQFLKPKWRSEELIKWRPSGSKFRPLQQSQVTLNQCLIVTVPSENVNSAQGEHYPAMPFFLCWQDSATTCWRVFFLFYKKLIPSCFLREEMQCQWKDYLLHGCDFHTTLVQETEKHQVLLEFLVNITAAKLSQDARNLSISTKRWGSSL